MNRQLMAVALAGSLGMVGALAPRVASAQEAKGGSAADRGTDADCPCETGGWHGRGMMGGGMMGGQRHGRWMERGGMMGGGMQGALRLGPIWRLDLSDGQRAELRKITSDFRQANWNTIGNLIDARAKLRDLESAAQPDPKQVGAAFADVSKLRQALLEAGVQARNRALGVLTPAQRQQLEQFRKQGPGGGFHGHGPGMMGQ